ncbi:hypothetical protein [Butyrivibrio sp. AE3004]|uniref:hypothetical protein n=1 Tax=Butyrivibrio sp. AE3004 TaxID=1506994 RepID=UPI0004944FD3|nr:hypothetical protein [Butyrivibrio sp. AE3004]
MDWELSRQHLLSGYVPYVLVLLVAFLILHVIGKRQRCGHAVLSFIFSFYLKEIVENHIAECEDCKKYYSQLKDGATHTAERSRHDQRIIKSISKEIRRKRNIAVGVAVIIVTLIAVVALFSTVDAYGFRRVFGEKWGVS